MKLKVYVMGISHASGTNFYINMTEREEREALLKYVRDNWPLNREMPEDEDELIEQYFELTSESVDQDMATLELNEDEERKLYTRLSRKFARKYDIGEVVIPPPKPKK